MLNQSNQSLYEDCNKETVQAYCFDRTFVLNGPIIKVYKNAEDEAQNNYQQLVEEMSFPLIKDLNKLDINPSNLLLHNNENNLMFMDESHS